MLSTPRWSTGWNIVRLVGAALIAAAIIAQAIRTISGAIDGGRDIATTVVNFFSFFTVLSNVGSVVVLTIAGIRGLVTRGRSAAEPFGLAVALACVATYMTVTGIVYNLLLRGIPLPQGQTVPWSNEVLHVVGPLILVADVFLAPTPRRLPWRAVLYVLVFPLAWVAYTLIRGPRVTNPLTSAAWWYPYPFLDPHQMGGYGGVVPYVIGIAVALSVVATGVVAMRRRRGAVDGQSG